MKKHGFTLAEVLITLGIVGVVAALTAPALVLSSRNEAIQPFINYYFKSGQYIFF